MKETRFSLLLLLSSFYFTINSVETSGNYQVTGFDPSFADSFDEYQTGTRGAVFNKCSPESKNDCVYLIRDRVGTRCENFATVIRNDSQYLQEMHSHFNFFRKTDESICLPRRGQQSSSRTLRFSDGQVLIVLKTECFEGNITVDTTQVKEEDFTHLFRNSLKDLAKAARQMSSIYAHKTVLAFRQQFGTHFVRKSIMGTSMFLSIRLENSISDALFAKVQSLAANLATMNDIVSEICSKEACENMKITTKVRGSNGVGIERYELQKLTDLIEGYPVSSGGCVSFNCAEQFNEEDVANVLEVLRRHDWNGSRACNADNSVLNEEHLHGRGKRSCGPSPIFPNSAYTNLHNYFDGLIITGGRTLNSTLDKVTTRGNIESVKVPTPSSRYGHTIFEAEHGTFFQVGGLGRSDEPTAGFNENNPNNEINISYHTTSNLVKSGPMHVANNLSSKIGPSGSLEIYDLPFEVSEGHCAVDNGYHVFFIGIGNNSNEIWVNYESEGYTINHVYKSFGPVNVLSTGRRGHRCLWTGTKIFVTGGTTGSLDDPNTQVVDTVDIIDTLNGYVRTGAKLRNKRLLHGIILWNGKPTVFGGLTEGNQLASTAEYYDEETDSWRELEETFGEHGHSFAWVQFYTRRQPAVPYYG